MRCAFWGVSREEGSQEVSPSICHRPSIWKVRNRRPLWTCPGRVVHCQKKLILLQKCSLSRSATRLWSQDHREAETTQGFLGRWPQGSLCPRTGDVTLLTPGSCHSMKWGENLQNRICCMWYLLCERVLWEQGQCSVCVCVWSSRGFTPEKALGLLFCFIFSSEWRIILNSLSMLQEPKQFSLWFHPFENGHF